MKHSKILILLVGVCVSSLVFGMTGPPAPSSPFSVEQAEVEAFLAAHEVRRVTNYCLTAELNCRSVVQYRSISTGLDVESFEDRFVSSKNSRAVSFRGFFLKRADGTFNIYSQDKLQNAVAIDTVEPVNQEVTITFDADDLPTIPVKFKIVGTDPVQYEDDTLVYTTTEATFTFNTADPSDDFVLPFHSQTIH